jgi:hypothetical protein
MELYFNGDFIQRRVLRDAQSVAPTPSDERNYKWKSKNKRLVQSRVVAIMRHAQRFHQSVFFLTFTEKVSIENNKVITDFVNNSRKQGFFDKFLWVRERQKRGANHYHLICSSNYKQVPVALLQRAWNSAQRSNGGEISNNSLRLGSRPLVYKENALKVANYISKYMSKGNQVEDYKLYANSRGLQAKIVLYADDLMLLQIPVFKTIYECEFFCLQKLTLDYKSLGKAIYLSSIIYN